MQDKLHYNEKLLKTALIVDDEMVNRELLGGILEDHYHLLYAEDGQQAMDILELEHATISIILLDLIMPHVSGLNVLQFIQEHEEYRNIPVIVLTSQTTAEVDSLNMGAVDFIPKPYNMPEVILSRVNRMVELFEDRQIIKAAERDVLTGLFSQNFFYEYCDMMENYHPERDTDAVVVNIDRFHLINEVYGRKYGDDVLKILANILKDYANNHEGIAGRGEDDTFYMYLNHQDRYADLTKKIQSKFATSIKNSYMHVRIGVYNKMYEPTLLKDMFYKATLACNTIRNKYHMSVVNFDKNLRTKIVFRERLIHDIHKAIERKQFIPYFQPKYNIQGEQPVLAGAEALVRWKHPEFGMISPGSFISLFEANGLIQIVDHYIWQEAAAQIKRWKEKYGFSIPISVNISRIDFYNPKLEEWLTQIVEENELRYDELHLEITESCYADNAQQLMTTVERLRKKGFVIELDDFGTGYSSLSVLSSLPIDVIKIDMKFINSMHENHMNMRIVEMIMDIARILKTPTIAEGVETKQQHDDLKTMGCNMIQGYYFSKPLPAEEFEDFFKLSPHEKIKAQK